MDRRWAKAQRDYPIFLYTDPRSKVMSYVVVPTNGRTFYADARGRNIGTPQSDVDAEVAAAIVGGMFGAFAGGPVGAVVGAIAGPLQERCSRSRQHKDSNRWYHRSPAGMEALSIPPEGRSSCLPDTGTLAS